MKNRILQCCPKRLALIAAILLFLGSCASTVVTGEWVSPAFERMPVRSTFVLGISSSQTTRRIFEDTFAKGLRARGVRAVAGYTLIPEEGEVAPDRLKQALQASGMETALVTRLVRIDRETRIYPGMGYTPYGFYPYGFYRGYHQAWGGFYDPPVVQEFVEATLESTLYDRESEGLVWSATTRTVDPSRLEGEVQELVTVLLDRLTKNGLIPPLA